ncbi:hypothetical protein GCM10027290_51190 [Micromonospora sonneratiae]|uniref:Uncharacterized protein n=1 Tax=Micromonospora sonneratiae TaxID=1184706 RepID=A0ABW3Y7W3_9ACTN
MLVPERRLAEILQISAAEILSPLDAPGNIGWQRVAVPSGSRTRDPYVGAPATRHDEIDYLWFPKENATRIALAAAVLEPVTRPEVAVRRWIAHRTAIVLRATSHRFTDIADIARALDINVSLLSADAIAALHGLIAESHGDLENEATFGFSGPDSLYE